MEHFSVEETAEHQSPYVAFIVARVECLTPPSDDLEIDQGESLPTGWRSPKLLAQRAKFRARA